MEPVLIIFVFMGVIAITALLVGGWVVFTVIRLILRGLVGLIAPTPLPPMPRAVPQPALQTSMRCANPKCRHANPAVAQFCRRCGAALPSAQRVTTRRVAMW